MKILTIADGFGDSWACPPWYPEYFKWPKILSMMTKGVEIIDKCRYGAGNEYMVSCLRENHHKADVVFLQWAVPNRLDLMLAHSHEKLHQWEQHISCDPIYGDNFQFIGDDKWWISSASKIAWAKEYHDRFISAKQHQLRSKIWVEYAHNLLKSKSHGFLLTWDSHYLQDTSVDLNAWVWHEPWRGMHDWRNHSRYRQLDLGLTQPIPLIHFDFIKQFIMPKFDLPWRSDNEIQEVESMLTRTYNQCKGNQP